VARVQNLQDAMFPPDRFFRNARRDFPVRNGFADRKPELVGEGVLADDREVLEPILNWEIYLMRCIVLR
jgi:hypothetical protein